MRIEFAVRGEPKGQPRPRAFAFAGRARIYDAGTAEGWKSCIAEAVRPYLPATPIETPVRVTIDFLMPRPKSHYRTGKNAGVLKDTAPKWFTSKPDIDNLEKAVYDALTIVGLLKDDSLVVQHSVQKYYADGHPGAIITVVSVGESHQLASHPGVCLDGATTPPVPSLP
jgi:Holliday junction resolvase RusA-like endonuclease